jgi:hypothetical protein
MKTQKRVGVIRVHKGMSSKPYAERIAEAKLTAVMRDAAAHETEDAKTGKLKLHPYLRNRLTKAEKIAARRNKT